MIPVHLNRKLGLKMMGGNEDLYNKFLNDFAVYNKSKPQELRCLCKNDLSAFKREVHTIKGQAGSVGAQVLQRLAEELEVSFSNQKLDRFCQELTLLCEEFHSVSLENAFEKKSQHKKTATREKIDALFDEIEDALNSGKPLVAKKSIMQLMDLELTEKDQKLIEEVSILVKQYQMKNAYQVMQIRKSNYY